jgi:bifunctional oligoribonuclease and PAP phosphatase NrnA
MNDLQEKIKGCIHAAQRILVTSHVRPDGDAIGSSLALALALRDIGKLVDVVLADGVPGNFKHLPGAEDVSMSPNGEYDLLISVDCSDRKRVGNVLSGGRAVDIVIDHHLTNDAFGTLNLIEPEAVATASVLMRHMPEWGLTVTKPIGANLLTGLVTDTLGFRTSNTTPEALRQAADLLELGVDMSRLYFLGLVRRTFPAARYWGAGLSNLQKTDGVVWTSLSLVERADSGYPGNDDADLINIVSSIDDADIAMVFVEQSQTNTKISWRGLKPDIDVSRIAQQFHGGGHKSAAGADVDGSFREVQERALQATHRALRDLEAN